MIEKHPHWQLVDALRECAYRHSDEQVVNLMEAAANLIEELKRDLSNSNAVISRLRYPDTTGQ